MKCTKEPVIKPESSKAVTRGLKTSQRAGGQSILHIPTPDYSRIRPKVDTWRREGEIVRDDEVSS
jgi:hypothetical protein